MILERPMFTQIHIMFLMCPVLIFGIVLMISAFLAEDDYTPEN